MAAWELRRGIELIAGTDHFTVIAPLADPRVRDDAAVEAAGELTSRSPSSGRAGTPAQTQLRLSRDPWLHVSKKASITCQNETARRMGSGLRRDELAEGAVPFVTASDFRFGS